MFTRPIQVETPPHRLLAAGLRFPEGPVVMPDGTVVVVEIASGKVTRVLEGGKVERIADVGGGPNGAALGPDGCLYVCNNGGILWDERPGMLRPVGVPPDFNGGSIQRVNVDTGEVTSLYDACDGHKFAGPNDLVFDAQGGFYFTDFGKMRPRDRDLGRIYYGRADGNSVIDVAGPFHGPNGIGLSPDGAILYVAEADTSRLWAFDILEPGKVTKQDYPSPHGGRLVNGLPGYQRYDSLSVAASGNICIATLITGHVTVISPAGELLGQIPFPDQHTTNLCFGGADLRTAFVTQSFAGTLIAVEWPEPGLRLNYQA